MINFHNVPYYVVGVVDFMVKCSSLNRILKCLKKKNFLTEIAKISKSRFNISLIS